MASFTFFTEPQKLANQTATQAFGAIDEDNYRLNNLFTATSDPKAFAITDGNILVQAVAGSTSLVNLVLKPNSQPDLDLPKIDYIIYKGLKKSSLVSGVDVAASGTNDLTTNVWTSFDQQVLELANAPASPLADEVLGMKYSASETEDYKALDTDSLNIAFFSDTKALFPVNSGDHIGEFDKTAFGIMIIFEKIGFEPTFKLARELDSKISFTALSETATHAEKFRRKHDKEDILAFLDSAAFMGAFDGAGINVFTTNSSTGSTSFEEKESDDFYSEIIQKHFNKNTLYLDIRNEYDDSYNYYENYGTNIQLGLDNTPTLNSVDYYQSSWPLLVLDDVDFDSGNPDKNIDFALPIGDNDQPLIFLKRGYKPISDVSGLPKGKDRYLALEVQGSHYLADALRGIKNTVDGKISANHYQLKYIKKYATPDSNYKGLSLKKESILDNLFPLFDMKTPFASEGSINMKIFDDAAYVDKSNINGSGFISNSGIAIDDQAVNFIAFPSIYNQLEGDNKAFLHLSGKQSFNGDSFIDDFNKTYVKDRIEHQTYDDPIAEKEYLTISKLDTSTSLVSTENMYITANKSSPVLRDDFDDVNIISLSKIEYQQLEEAKDVKFTAPYKVYLGIANTVFLDIDKTKATTVFALRGIKENATTGELETYEHITSIEVFADDDLYNWEADTETGVVEDAYWVDANGNGTTQMPYEEDVIRFRVKSKDAIWEVLTVKFMHHRNFGVDLETLTITKIVNGDDIIISLPCSPSFYGTPDVGMHWEANIKEFYLNIQVGKGKFKEFSSADGGRLKIHAVRFVPDVCRANSWLQALSAQEFWFKNPENPTMDLVDPGLDLYDLSWVRGFQRALLNYNNAINDVWNSNNAINVLQGEIRDMISDGFVTLPTVSGSSTFGTFSNQIITKITSAKPQGERMPLYEKYYYGLINQETERSDPIDDLTATLGSFNWHIAAKGKLEYIDGISIKVTIEHIRIYIKDSFDFVDGNSTLGTENYLGEWDFINNNVEIGLFRPTGFFTIHNKDYRNYRDDISKGFDHYRYSRPDDLAVNHDFTMTISP